MRLSRLLLATDFSKASANAFATALALAKATGGTLTVLHVIAPLGPFLPEQYVGMQAWEDIDRQTREWAKGELRRIAEKAERAGVRTAQLLVGGQPAEQVVRVARARKMDLIVLGTHGRSGLSRLVLGSVAARVVATARVPVVTVRGK